MKLDMKNGNATFDIEPGDMIGLLEMGDPDVPAGQALIIFPPEPFPENKKMEFKFDMEVKDLRWALWLDGEIFYISQDTRYIQVNDTFTLEQK